MLGVFPSCRGTVAPMEPRSSLSHDGAGRHDIPSTFPTLGAAMRLLLLAIASSLFMLTGCAATIPPVHTDPTDVSEQRMIPLSEVAATLGLEMREGGFIGMQVLSDARGNEAVIYRKEPTVYRFNLMARAVEFPYVQYTDDEELYIPVGMFNSLCRDFGRIDALITGQGTRVDRPFKDAVKLNAPDPSTITRPTAAKPATQTPAKAMSNTLSGLIIVVDAGHGGKDPGGVGVGGIYEKDIALSTSLKVKKLLEGLGASVIMTRSDDTFIELAERAEIANRRNADMFISIHANMASNESASGIETWYSAEAVRGTLSSSLADSVNKAMVANTKAVDRGPRADQRGLRVLRSTNMPAVLVELGFMSNAGEAKKLTDAKYQDKLAAGIVKGIREYAAAVPKTSDVVSK